MATWIVFNIYRQENEERDGERDAVRQRHGDDLDELLLGIHSVLGDGRQRVACEETEDHDYYAHTVFGDEIRLFLKVLRLVRRFVLVFRGLDAPYQPHANRGALD